LIKNEDVIWNSIKNYKNDSIILFTLQQPNVEVQRIIDILPLHSEPANFRHHQIKAMQSGEPPLENSALAREINAFCFDTCFRFVNEVSHLCGVDKNFFIEEMFNSDLELLSHDTRKAIISERVFKLQNK